MESKKKKTLKRSNKLINRKNFSKNKIPLGLLFNSEETFCFPIYQIKSRKTKTKIGIESKKKKKKIFLFVSREMFPKKA